MGVVSNNASAAPPPFPFTVDTFVAEIRSDKAAQAAQACAALATLCAQTRVQVMVPPSFRAAVPAVVALLTRRDEGFGAAAVNQSATAALSALLACVEGAAEDAVAEGLVGKLLAAARDGGGESGGTGGERRSLDLNALECIRVLASNDTGAASLIANDDAMAFVTARCGGADAVEAAASEAAADVLCVLASNKTDGGGARAAVVRAGGVGALARALVAWRARSDEVTVRALLGLAMTTSEGAQQAELVGVPGAVPAVVAASRSRDQTVAGISKDLWGVLGRNQALKPALAAALRSHAEEQQRLGAVHGMDAA